jgi:transcriptional regulator with XRE-family HTH domain
MSKNRKVKGADVIISAHLYRFRRLAGISREALGGVIGVTPQQIQKYETAANRVPTVNLVRMAKFLEVDITEFLKDILIYDKDDESINKDLREFLYSEEYRSGGIQ